MSLRISRVGSRLTGRCIHFDEVAVVASGDEDVGPEDPSTSGHPPDPRDDPTGIGLGEMSNRVLADAHRDAAGVTGLTVGKPSPDGHVWCTVIVEGVEDLDDLSPVPIAVEDGHAHLILPVEGVPLRWLKRRRPLA